MNFSIEEISDDCVVLGRTEEHQKCNLKKNNEAAEDFKNSPVKKHCVVKSDKLMVEVASPKWPHPQNEALKLELSGVRESLDNS